MNRQSRSGLPVLNLRVVGRFGQSLFEHKTQSVFDQLVGRFGRVEFG